MPETELQPTWIVRPIAILSFFTAYFVLDAIKSASENGLSILVKAACAFIVALVFTTTTANILLQSPPEDGPRCKSPYDNLESKTARASEDIREPRPAQRDNVRVTAAGDSWISGLESTRRDEKPGRKKLEKGDGRTMEDNKIRLRLMKKFAPKKSGLLGGKKETVAKVLEEA